MILIADKEWKDIELTYIHKCVNYLKFAGRGWGYSNYNKRYRQLTETQTSFDLCKCLQDPRWSYENCMIILLAK